MVDQSSPRPPRALASFDRLSLLISFVLVGLTLSLMLDLPTHHVQFSFLGSEASFTLSGTWLLAALLAALTAAGVDSIVRMHPSIHLVQRPYIVILWILPMVITVTATMLLALTQVRVYGLISILLAGALLVGVIIGEYFTIDMDAPRYSAARLGVNIAVYLTALILFATIYSWKLRSLYSASAIGLAAGLLALELLRGNEEDFQRTWLYAAAVGLCIAEVVWALNYWNLNGFRGGAFLLIFFYAFTGLAQQYLWRRLSRLVLVEFTVIFFGAIVLLFWLIPTL